MRGARKSVSPFQTPLYLALTLHPLGISVNIYCLALRGLTVRYINPVEIDEVSFSGGASFHPGEDFTDRIYIILAIILPGRALLARPIGLAYLFAGIGQGKLNYCPMRSQVLVAVWRQLPPPPLLPSPLALKLDIIPT